MLTRSAMTPPKSVKKQKRNGPAKADHAEPEGGVIAEGEHQPALGDVLHPGADVGEEVAAPEEAEVGIAQGTCNLGKAAVFFVGEGRRSGGRLFDSETARGFIRRARRLIQTAFGL